MKKTVTLILMIVLGMAVVVLLARWMDDHRGDEQNQLSEEPLYLKPDTARHLSLAFNGLAADWYWMRSLQYVGRKIVSYEDKHEGSFELSDLSSLDIRQLPSLLRVSTNL